MTARHPRFDRERLEILPVGSRESKFRVEDIAVDPDGDAGDPGALGERLDLLADRVVAARRAGRPVVICHGAHLIKNGLGTLLIRMVREGWIQHIATNGAGSIHDWEFGFFGRSCEDVRAYVAKGQFGIWDETGRVIGLSLAVGGLDGLGYGAAVGRTMVEGGMTIPSRAELLDRLRAPSSVPEGRGAAADLLDLVESGRLAPGRIELPHSHLAYSVQATCRAAGVPFTVHPGIGQDIIYTHPLFLGGAVGRASMADFLIYAESIRNLPGGVYISAGSSVMSPMIFEKSVSMSRNLARQTGTSFDDFFIAVNDLADATWDWSGGEPPIDHPAYYVRFCKSFSRMGGRMEYYGLDNRVFLLQLYRRLSQRWPSR
jgi:hypothetical protein